MTLDSDTTRILGSHFNQHGLETTWLSLIKTHVHTLQKTRPGLENFTLTDPKYSTAILFPDDLLYDLTIGEISVLYEYSLTYMNTESRKDTGQFFAPDDVSLYMVNQTIRYLRESG